MFLKRWWTYILCKHLSIPCTLHTSTTKSMRLPEYGLFRFDAVGNMDDNDTINALSLCACVFVLDLELLQSDLRAWQCWHSPSERTLDYNEFDLWSRPMALLYSVLFCLKEVKILVTLCFLLILLFFFFCWALIRRRHRICTLDPSFGGYGRTHALITFLIRENWNGFWHMSIFNLPSTRNDHY